MAKETTIRLTPEQREQIRKLTGEEHDAVKVEAVPGRTGAPLVARQALQGKGLYKRTAMKGKKLAPSGKRQVASGKRGIGPGL